MSSRIAPLANIKAEQAFLGALLRSPQAYFSVADVVKPDMMTVPIHRDMLALISDILISGRTVSFSALGARLPPETEDGQDTVALLHTLAHNAEGLNPADFGEQIAETANRRRLLAVSEAMARAARTGSAAALDIASEAEVALLEVMQVSAPRRPQLLSDIARGVVVAAKLAKDVDVLAGFTWGLPTLDEIMGRVLPGDLGFILAAQGDGKSALVTQLGVHVSRSLPVMMVQLEMGQEQIAARELAAQGRMPVRVINEGSFDAFQLDTLIAAEKALAGLAFWILDAPDITVRQLRAHCLGMQRTCGLALLIIDQLDKMKADGRHKDRFERGAEITRDLKYLAKELKIAIIVLAQRTRGSQRRDDPEPDILDADFPSLERDADWVLALWRRESWLRRNKPNGRASGETAETWEADLRRSAHLAHVMALKRRRGATYDARPLHWEGMITRFSELTGMSK